MHRNEQNKLSTGGCGYMPSAVKISDSQLERVFIVKHTNKCKTLDEKMYQFALKM